MKKQFSTNIFKYMIMFCSLLILPTMISAYDIVFDDDLNTVFDNLDDQYTETIFTENGNNFAGVIFWQGDIDLDTEEPVGLVGSTEELTCQYQLRGLYFNPQRGNSLRPLDQESLDLLRTIDDGTYDDVTVTGGLYKGCNGDNDDYIYGQVTNERNSMEYKVVAGVAYSGNDYLQSFAENAEWFDDKVGIDYFRDSWGGVLLSTYVASSSVDSFSFPVERNADVDEYYLSDEIEVDGLIDGTQILAYLGEFSKGVMFINGDFIGKSGYVENGDEIEIELKSSDDYENITSTTLFIGDESATYYIMTESEDANNDDDEYELSISEQLIVILTFKEMVDVYGSNSEKLEDFLFTFRSLLEDELDIAEDDNEEEEVAKLEYLLEVIDSYLLEHINDDIDLPFGDTDRYIAPNCKVYEIEYNNERQAYYSPDFVYMHYFISREALETYVDERNLGNENCSVVVENDGDRTTRVSPNGKVYKIERTNGGYTSFDFITTNKYFDSIEAIRKYIDFNNPKLEVRNHDLLDGSEPIQYSAPNGKDYEILNTTRGYMSYRFLSVNYFTTLNEIQDYIDVNNPA